MTSQFKDGVVILPSQCASRYAFFQTVYGKLLTRKTVGSVSRCIVVGGSAKEIKTVRCSLTEKKMFSLCVLQ